MKIVQDVKTQCVGCREIERLYFPLIFPMEDVNVVYQNSKTHTVTPESFL